MVRVSEFENDLPMLRALKGARSIGSATATALGTTVDVCSMPVLPRKLSHGMAHSTIEAIAGTIRKVPYFGQENP